MGQIRTALECRLSHWYHVIPGRGFREFRGIGGEGGIRTHGTRKGYNGFRDRPDRPLWHLSAANISAGAARAQLAGPLAGAETRAVMATGGIILAAVVQVATPTTRARLRETNGQIKDGIVA